MLQRHLSDTLALLKHYSFYLLKRDFSVTLA